MIKEPSTETLSLSNDDKPLPKGWRLVRLGEICEINPPRSTLADKLTDHKDETPTSFVQMSAVDERLGIIARPEIKPFGQVKKGYTIFAESDVIFAKITPCMQNGKNAIATNLVNGFGFGSTEFHVLRPNENIINSWIHYFLRQPDFLKFAMTSFTGAVGQQRVPEKFLADFKIPLPPTIEEQRRIAAILDEQMKTVEEARLAVEAQLKAANLLPNAFLRAVFESEDAQNWEKRKLGEVCEIKRGKFSHRPRNEPRFFGGNYPFIQTGDVVKAKGGRVGYTQTLNDLGLTVSKLFEPTVVLVTIAANIGDTAILDYEACFTDSVVGLIPTNGTNPYFLEFVMRTKQETLNQLAPQAAQKNINIQILSKIDLTMPPIEEQTRIAERLKQQMKEVEALKKSLTEKLEAVKKLPAALLRKAFAGEI